jgi:ribosomal protein L13E
VPAFEAKTDGENAPAAKSKGRIKKTRNIHLIMTPFLLVKRCNRAKETPVARDHHGKGFTTGEQRAIGGITQLYVASP